MIATKQPAGRALLPVVVSQRSRFSGSIGQQVQAPGAAVGAMLVRRVGQRTATFADVLAVASAERVKDLGSGIDQADAVAVVDAVIDVVKRRPAPSAAAVMLAWAGGVVHTRQAVGALAAAGNVLLAADPDLTQCGEGRESFIRLADPSARRFAAPLAALAGRVRREMAAAVLREAVEICADPGEPVVGRIVAGRATHRIRADLTGHDLSGVVEVQCALVADLETVGDLAEAAHIASEALADCPSDTAYSEDRNALAAAMFRFASAVPSPGQDPIVRELVDEAMASGAALGLEARVWAAISLFDMAVRREDAGRLAEQALSSPSPSLAGELDLLQARACYRDALVS